MARPVMGKEFADRMYRRTWTHASGWSPGGILDRTALPVGSAAPVLHYGQSVFEGMKAFARPDGSVAVFRVAEHAARFRDSAARLGLPEVSADDFLEALRDTVRANLGWVPRERGTSLYLRPFLFSSAEGLGPSPAAQAEFIVIATPSATEYAPGDRGRSAWAATGYSRSSPGGTGDVKCAGNYAPGIAVAREAAAHGFDQVLWMNPVDRDLVEEMGSMNLFFVYEEDGRTVLRTPRLSGTFLPGITRRSVIEWFRDRGEVVEEAPISLQRLRIDAEGGGLREVFGTGTAAFITPVTEIGDDQGRFAVGDGKPGRVTGEVWSGLLDIHTGASEDRLGWLTPVA